MEVQECKIVGGVQSGLWWLSGRLKLNERNGLTSLVNLVIQLRPSAFNRHSNNAGKNLVMNTSDGRDRTGTLLINRRATKHLDHGGCFSAPSDRHPGPHRGPDKRGQPAHTRAYSETLIVVHMICWRTFNLRCVGSIPGIRGVNNEVLRSGRSSLKDIGVHLIYTFKLVN